MDFAQVVVGVAVFAGVEAGVVGADVSAFDAVAAGTHAFVFEVAEFDAVGCAEHIERHAAGGVYAVAREVAIGATGLEAESVLLSDAAEAGCQLFFVLFCQGYELGHVDLKLLVHLDKAEDAAVDIGGKLRGHAGEGVEVFLNGVGGREEHGIVPPGDAFFADDIGEVDERVDALLNGGDARLDIFAIGGDSVVKVGVEAFRNLLDVGQDGREVF